VVDRGFAVSRADHARWEPLLVVLDLVSLLARALDGSPRFIPLRRYSAFQSLSIPDRCWDGPSRRVFTAGFVRSSICGSDGRM
jgi:hypothetical protein